MRVALYGAAGKVGRAARAGARRAPGTRSSTAARTGPAGCDAAIDFTTPGRGRRRTSTACLDARVPVVIGTTGFDLDAVDARRAGGGRPVLPRAELRPRRRADDALRRGGGEGLPASGDRRAAPRGEARRAVGHGEGDGGADGDEPADPLGAPPRPRRAPGGHLRRTGGDAHDPARHDLARGVRPRRPARPRAGSRAPAGPDGRPRRPAVLSVVGALERGAASLLRARRSSSDDAPRSSGVASTAAP